MIELPVGEPCPEVLAEDPIPGPLARLRGAAVAVGLGVVLVLLAGPCLVAGLAYAALRLGYPRPPVVPSPAAFRRFARRVLTTAVPPPGLHPIDRARLALHLARAAMTAPLHGLAWYVDELVYGRALADHPVVAPVFEISAWRSGSTRLAHALADDPAWVAPNTLQIFVPYLWVWRLAQATLGWVDRDALARRLRAALPPDLVERHEVDPWKTDTFDVVLYSFHLVPFALALGPAVIAEEFRHGELTASNRALWEEELVRMADGLGRRVQVFAGKGRFFLKGHFLAAAPALAARWPDATFVAVSRPLAPRLRSTLNYLRLSPDFFGLGRTPWRWIAAYAGCEVAYDRAERAWYGRDDGVKRCVVPFAEVTDDLPAALSRVYATIGAPLPAVRAPAPPPHHQGRYRLDHPLEALGVRFAAWDLDETTRPSGPT